MEQAMDPFLKPVDSGRITSGAVRWTFHDARGRNDGAGNAGRVTNN